MDTIRNIRNKVALYYSNRTDIAPYDFAAYVIVELIGSKIQAEDGDKRNFGELIDIISNVNAFVGKKKYTRESLVQIVKDIFLTNFSIADITRIIGNTKFHMFPDMPDGSMSFKSVSLSPPKLRDNYGNLEYEITAGNAEQETLAQIQISNSTEESTVEDKSMPPATDDQHIVKLKSFFNQIKSDKRFFWQWRISRTNYKRLEELLKSIHFGSGTT